MRPIDVRHLLLFLCAWESERRGPCEDCWQLPFLHLIGTSGRVTPGLIFGAPQRVEMAN